MQMGMLGAQYEGVLEIWLYALHMPILSNVELQNLEMNPHWISDRAMCYQ